MNEERAEERLAASVYLRKLAAHYRNAGAPSSADALDQAARVIAAGNHIQRRAQVVLKAVKKVEGT